MIDQLKIIKIEYNGEVRFWIFELALVLKSDLKISYLQCIDDDYDVYAEDVDILLEQEELSDSGNCIKKCMIIFRKVETNNYKF